MSVWMERAQRGIKGNELKVKRTEKLLNIRCAIMKS